MSRIAYLIPGFPDQTHAFFWREIGELRKLEYDLLLISTRLPAKAIQPHTWTKQATSITTYLHPISSKGLGLVLGGLMAAGFFGMARALRVAWGEAGIGISRRIRNYVLIFYSLELTGLARRQGIEHVHVHSCADAALMAALAQRLGGLSYSLTLHGPLGDYGPQQHLKWRYAAFAIVITKLLEAQVREKLGDDVPDELQIAPMGVDLDQFDRQAPYRVWRRDRPARLFSCARLNLIKGFDELIRAVRLLVDRGIDVHLRIAGQDEVGGTGYALKLQALIEELDLAEHVTLLGSQSAETVRKELEQADLFVLASHREPLGVAIMEAMAMGCPVVTTNAGGVPELVDHGVDGYLVPPYEVDQLAGAIEKLLGDPALTEQLALSGRAKIEHAFHSGISAAAINGCLKHVLPKNDAARHSSKARG